MTVTQRDYLAQKEYYKDQARAARNYRLVREAMAGQDRGNRLVCRTLTWLGQRLVNWGTRLQAQYSAMLSPPVSQSVGQTVRQ
jgi:hypothetical protein